MKKIKLTNVWKAYGTQQILRGLNLELEEGETLVILGRSGAGKSVTLRQILGLEHPDEGTVEVDGFEVSSMSQSERFRHNKHVSMLFQSAALFDSLTVGENAAFFLTEHPDIHTGKWISPKEIGERVNHALELVGLPGIQNKMPSELSGGMRRRVGLARLIVYRPTIILYDEPTAGLDPVTAMSINKIIVKTQKELKATSIVVTHDLRSASEVADRIAYHHEGQIIQNAPTEQFFSIDDPRVQAFLENSRLPDSLSETRKHNA